MSMNVRLFQRDDKFFAISTEGTNNGFTFSKDLKTCIWNVPDLAFLRLNAAEVERKRAMNLLRVIQRNQLGVDLKYGEAVRVIFREATSGEIIAIFPDLPYTGTASEIRMLGFTYSGVGVQRPVAQFFGVDYRELRERSKPASEKNALDLKQELENSCFPQLRQTRVNRPKIKAGR